MDFSRHFGVRPRRPERLLVLAAGLVLALLVVALAFVLAALGEFGRHAPRQFYYLWLLGLIAVALAAAARPRLAALLLTLAAIDLGLGVASRMAEGAGLVGATVMPPPFNFESTYRWHPLLQAAPIPSATGGPPGIAVAHTSAGTRGRERSAAELADRTVIATFGGSTTFDIAVTDGATWPERLEQELEQKLGHELGHEPGGERFAVVNHGVPGYSSAEHLVQTAFYQEAFGRSPDCALYYVGWNDLRSAGLDGLDPAYADHHLPSQVDSLTARRIGPHLHLPSPVATLALRLAAIATDTVRPARPPAGRMLDAPDPQLEKLFLRNVASISAINRTRSIRTVWIGQLLNRAALTGDSGGWTPLIRGRDVWPFQKRLNARLKATATKLGDAYAGVPIEKFTAADFADSGHFSARGSARFARLLAPAVRRACSP